MKKGLFGVLICVVFISLAAGACAKPTPAPTPTPTPSPTPAPSPTPTPPAPAEEKIVWKAETPWPAGLAICQEAAERFSNNVKAMSDGRLTIDLYIGGTLVPSADIEKAVSEGALDLGLSWTGYIRSTFPVADLFAAVPGGPEPVEYIAWILKGGGLQLWQEMYDTAKWNVKVLPPYSVQSAEDFAWANKPIQTMQDFKGLKFRAGGYYWGKVLEKMGAAVVALPGAEVVPSLERGVIDAAEYGCPAINKSVGLQDACKYCIVPGIHQPASIDETLVNKDSWEKLPDDLKAIVEAAAMDAFAFSLVRDMELNPIARQFFKDQGVEVITLSSDVQKEAKRLIDEVYNEEAVKDPFFAKVLKSQQDFLKVVWPYAEENHFSYK